VTRARKWLAALAMSLTLQAPAIASGSDEVQFEITDTGHLVVTVHVNDRTSLAILDTAATFPILDRETANAAAIYLPEVPELIDIVGLGEVRTFPLVQIGQLALGTFELEELRAAYNSKVRFPSTGNVFPASALPYRTLDFDFERHRLLMYDRAPASIRGAHVERLPIARHGGLPFVKVRVNGVEGLALVDTGASLSYVNSAFAQGAARSSDAIRSIELIGATGNATSITVLHSRRFELGSVKLDRFDVVVSNPEFLEMLGLENVPVMVLGIDILKAFRLQIDREKEELRLVLPGRGPLAQAGISFRAR